MLDRSNRPRLVLASSSPRRAELLDRLDLEYEVRPADVDETPLPNEAPGVCATRVATAKVEAAWEPGTVTIAADTIVSIDGQLFGKPKDADDARRMLRRLSGNVHDVFTAVAVRAEGTAAGPLTRTAFERTDVRFVELTVPRIEWYVSTEEPFDKAGAYAIQGKGTLFVESIRGNVDNVIGLPLTLVDQLVNAAGYDLLAWAS